MEGNNPKVKVHTSTNVVMMPFPKGQNPKTGQGLQGYNCPGGKRPAALTLLMYSSGVRLKVGRSSVRVSPMPAVFQL